MALYSQYWSCLEGHVDSSGKLSSKFGDFEGKMGKSRGTCKIREKYVQSTYLRRTWDVRRTKGVFFRTKGVFWRTRVRTFYVF